MKKMKKINKSKKQNNENNNENNKNDKKKQQLFILMLFIGVEKGKYLQINIENIKYFDNKIIGIIGSGKPLNEFNKECNIINVEKYEFY